MAEPLPNQELDIYEQRKLDLYDRIDSGELTKEEASRIFHQEPQSDPMATPGLMQENALDGLSDGQFFDQSAENPDQNPAPTSNPAKSAGTDELSPLEQQKLDIYDQLDRGEITKEQARQRTKDLGVQAAEPQGVDIRKSILERDELPDEEVARRDRGHVGKYGQPYQQQIHSELKRRRMTLKSDIYAALKTDATFGKSLGKSGIDIDTGAPFKIRSEFSWSKKNMAKIFAGKGQEAMAEYISELNTRLRSFKGYENGVVIPIAVGDDKRYLGKKNIPQGKVDPTDIVLVYKKNRSDENEPVKLVDEYALNWKDMTADITGDMPQIAGSVATTALMPGGFLKTIGTVALGAGAGDLTRRAINQLVLPKTQAEIKRQLSGKEIGFTAGDVAAQIAPDVLTAGIFKAFEPLVNKIRGVGYFHPEKRAMLDAVRKANDAAKTYKKEAAESLQAKLDAGEISQEFYDKSMARVDKLIEDLPAVMANQVSDSKALDKMFKQGATVDPDIDYKYAQQLQGIVDYIKTFMPGGRGLGKRAEALKKKTLAMYEHERITLLKEAGFNPASMGKLDKTLKHAGRGAVQTLKNKESALHTNLSDTAEKLGITFDITKLKQVVEKVEQQGIQPDSQIQALMRKIDNLDKSEHFLTPAGERISFGMENPVPPIKKIIKFQDLKDIRTQLIRLADEELKLAGSNTGPVKQLIKGLTETLKNPNNPVSPASRKYIRAFNQANQVSVRKINLLKSDAYQRIFKTDSPAKIADEYGKPGILDADVLQELRASAPDAFKKYRGAVVDNHILNAADGKATERLLKWADNYPDEYKVLIGKGGDSKRLFRAAQRMDALADSNVGRVIQKQVETGHFIREMINAGKTQKDMQEMIRFYSRRTSKGDMPGRKLLRDGMFQDLFDQAVVTGKHGLLEVSGKKLLTEIDRYKKLGLWGILTKNEKARMTGLESYLRLINEKSAGDFAVSLQGHELVSKVMSKQMIPAAIELRFKQKIAKFLSSKKASEFIMSANKRKPLDSNRLYRAITIMDGMLEGTDHKLDEGFVEKMIRRLEQL